MKKVLYVNPVGLDYTPGRETESAKRLFQAHKVAVEGGYTEFVDYGEFEFFSQEPLDFLVVNQADPDYEDIERQLVEHGYSAEEIDV